MRCARHPEKKSINFSLQITFPFTQSFFQSRFFQRLLFFNPDPVKPNILYKFNILKVTENKPIDTTIGTRVTSIPGNQLTLTCNVSGLPTPSIAWKRNNLLAQEGGSTFVVPSLKGRDSGPYTCIATNLAGVTSVTSNVIVIGMNMLVGSAQS
jgi:hypothetical protein